VPQSLPPPLPAEALASAASRENHWQRWLLAPTTAVMVLGAVLWWFSRSKPDGIDAQARTKPEITTGIPSIQRPRPAPKIPVVQATAPEPQKTAATEPSNAEQLFNSMKLQGIFYRVTNPTALISGKSVGVGDHVNGVEVIEIGPTNVTLGLGTERKVLQLK
jgi:hypothetical protein